jgi:hypothetical protein
MSTPIAVWLESGAKRTFASAIEWPGWSRSGRDEAAALAALAAAGPRYVRALADLARGLEPPADSSELDVRERVAGGSGTDFGVPSRSPGGDDRPVGEPELARLAGILNASWTAFDATAAAAFGHELTKGPRGGGRGLPKIVRHIFESDWAYLGEIGGRFQPARGASPVDLSSALRALLLETLAARVDGEPAPPSRRTRPLWTPRYLVRRSAWHALDHTWEIEDRMI